MANLEAVPGRVFLDTCVVNFILDHGEEIHDGCPPAEGLSPRQQEDILALRDLWIVGQRASWQLAVSPYTYHEVTATRSSSRAGELQAWFFQIWEYWREFLHTSSDFPTFGEAEELRLELARSDVFDVICDMGDRALLCDAVVYRCDAFCTRDWSTILRFRDSLPDLPLRILTPTEWWRLVAPHRGLWHM